ncbi:MFS general substrate transporter [Exidia glandulosa HHB12029]|uniref:MFS general substrate transporter n=1 Tax=Exidia glandulosa HHB12029 TaxID=1314781 RepID=A0A165EMR3_EXIGL|nr:MFS general substrate transporter [Exidia glandulosa HHB12029]
MSSRARDREELEPLVVQPRETPLPKLQLTILCLVRLAEPIAYTQVFPYVNRMMEHLHVTDDPRQIGFYSGLVESVFSFAQLLFIFQWGRLSDRIGRKPIILCGLCGSALSTMCFGLSSSLPAALAARMLAGGLAGNAAVIQSMLGELTDETNQARAFPLLGLCWNLGCIIGPLIGGALSEPATGYPAVFGRIQFLKDYPFFLPCAVSCSLTLCSIILGYIALEETLPSKLLEKTQALDTEAASSNTYGAVTAQPLIAPETVHNARPSILSLISDPIVISVVRTYFMLAMSSTAFEVLFVLLSYTAIAHGGLSRNPLEIGSALALGGLVAVILQPLAYPVLSRRVKLSVLYPSLMAIYPFLFIMLPFLNVVARNNLADDSDDKLTPHGSALVWTSIAVILILARTGGMCSSANMISIKHAAPSQDALGSTFGVAQTVAAVARGISPAMASSLFAVTLEHSLLNGWFVWVIMFMVGIVSVLAASQVKDGLVERKKAADRTQ